ncbi:MAG TPA: molybdenum cofactor biosynthesis protein MoaE [Bacteroidia bacterium]|nr:molybdenum cofactor biosynthesis protein MoaE [Bacteroidia bacterium]
MTEKKKKEVFVEGPIAPQKIADSISKHASMKDIGAHSIFLGQVRADEIEGRKVTAIEYTCYREMADEVFFNIRESAFSKFNLSCMHIYHSLGRVEVGQISLFVFTSSVHRKMAIDACSYIVEEIKAKAPVWGKEILEDDSYIWKKNTSSTP